MSERDEKLDPVAETLLALVAARGPGKSICPTEAAQAFAEPRRKKSDPKDVWRRYLPAVRQQALHLARQGRIDILRRGQRQDPDRPIKGVIRLTLPGWAPQAPAKPEAADEETADEEAADEETAKTEMGEDGF